MTDRHLRSDSNSRRAADDQVLRDAAIMRKVLTGRSSSRVDRGSTRPFLVMLSGLPGTGKSYFARQLVERVPFLVLESDRLRKALVPHPKYTPGEHTRVFAACHLLLQEFLGQGRRVLFDAANLTEKYRQPVYQMAGRASAPLVVIGFIAPEDTVRRRLAERAAGLDPGNYSDADWLIHTRLRQSAQPIQREHLTVDTSGDIEPALEQIVRLIRAGGESGRGSSVPSVQ